MHLFEKLLQVRAPLVPHPCFGKQAAAATGLENADAEVNVLAKAHLGKPSQTAINLRPHPHVEGTRIEFVHLLLPPADAPRGEEGCHGVIDGFLHGSERFVRTIRPSKRIRRLTRQLVLHGLQVTRRKHTVGIQHNQILARTTFRPVIPGLSRPGVILRIILHVQPVPILPHHVTART